MVQFPLILFISSCSVPNAAGFKWIFWVLFLEFCEDSMRDSFWTEIFFHDLLKVTTFLKDKL